ncbi:MAG: YceI family protein [Pacificimonas sp.]|jgi:polyisoprenoid-binding protein YceI|nr:YceI family protein [Pacificimonas sp.]
MKPNLAALFLILLPTGVLAQDHHSYRLNPAASAVSAEVPFLLIGSKTAGFPDVTGAVRLNQADPTAIDLRVTLDAAALTAGDDTTLRRLRGEKFFDVATYPDITFTGTIMTPTGPDTAVVGGDLTARGITQPVNLSVTFGTPLAALPNGKPVALTAETTINRRDFGMTSYGLIVGNRVTILIETQMAPE